MSGDIRAEYDIIKESASTISREAERIKKIGQDLNSKSDPLKQGWLGRGSDAFQGDMASVLSAFKRLYKALSEANTGLNKIGQLFQTGEQEAASYLNQMGQASGGSNPGGDSSSGGGANSGGTNSSGGSNSGGSNSGGSNSGGGSTSSSVPTTETPSTNKMHLTPDELMKAMPGLSKQKAEQYAPLLNKAMDEYNINTPERRNMFLAQVGHESGSFRYFRELGNDAYFTRYDGRKDLGNTEPGDGARFRGRGAIQITGRNNYEQAGRALGLDLVNHPELLEQPENAIRASAWWWQSHGLNEKVDSQPTDVRGITRVINGGYNGLDDRVSRFENINGALGTK